jgi:hypothetical protein
MAFANGNGVAAIAHTQRCRMCGATAFSGALTDVYGAAVCQQCLRRIDADPRQKRHLMLSMGDAIYW